MTTMLLSTLIIGWILYLLINGDMVRYIQLVKPASSATSSNTAQPTPAVP